MQIREVDWDPAEDEEGGSSDGTNEDEEEDGDDGGGDIGDQMGDDDQIDIQNDPNLIMIKPDPDGAKRPVQVDGYAKSI